MYFLNDGISSVDRRGGGDGGILMAAIGGKKITVAPTYNGVKVLAKVTF